ncbi:endonuclease/exonuclease/phosphatase family protein [Rhodococcus erythropolis]|uniref:endonuclease/exonuclease/phosphatase family protein n=1 Tax=Rhodococcus erythropolis TaxID=1833 RepID=UPI0029493950|nr:endonuclease/exonuclease/phosphatase family protein [Rhodococcus erythropolis]MDV6272647.1 endonuclease/exonuclease/phosphatase family protein [Rhodococcus erythropolis]
MEVMQPDTVTPRRRVLRRLTAVVGVAGIAAGLAALAATVLDVDHNIVIVLASVAPLLMIAPLIGAVVSGIGRQWIVCAASILVLGLFGWSVIPLYIGGTGESTSAAGPSIRIMQANLMVGAADPESLVATVRERNVDVVTVQELTYEEAEALKAAGLEEVLSHQFLVPYTDGGGGAGIYSRFPLSNPRSLDGFSPETLSAELNVGLSQPVTLFAVHPAPAYISPASVWAAEQRRLGSYMDKVAGRDNVIVSGDFNASYSNKQFRNLLTNGYTSAADQLGSGLIPTYPTDKWFPAAVGIDHIITKGAVATSLERIKIEGSDHHGLIADITLD